MGRNAPLSQDAAQGGPEAALVCDVIKDAGSPRLAACHRLGFERGAVMDKGAPHSLFSADGCQDRVPTPPGFHFPSCFPRAFNQGLEGNCSVDKQLAA